MNERRVWTLIIEGSTKAIIRAPGNPSIHHDGATTLAQVFSTRDQVLELIAGLPSTQLQGRLITPVDSVPPCDELLE